MTEEEAKKQNLDKAFRQRAEYVLANWGREKLIDDMVENAWAGENMRLRILDLEAENTALRRKS
jgi:hypothetical protein